MVGSIVISENATLDGVIQDPAGDEGFKHGGWVGRITDRPSVGRAALDEAMEADAFLFGRRTYEFFASRWPSRSGALADRLNGLSKYVASSTLDEPDWNNTTVLRGDTIGQVSALKQALDGRIIVPGSITLARALLEHDLVDELRLIVFPVVLGDGERLFTQTGAPKTMRLVGTRTGDDVVFLTYDRFRKL